MSGLSSNKAKIARRVVEVLEFFDDSHGEATVMDIVRRYKRPQSSTSELLSCLVDLGLLYKDDASRSYRPTPRAALLGSQTQPEAIREGKLTQLMDRLAAQTGLCVGLFGMVGVQSQIFAWRSQRDGSDCGLDTSLCTGRLSPLTESAAGWMLLATQSRPRREGIVRRLNAEAAGEVIPYAEAIALIDACERHGHASGPAGFGSKSASCAVLLSTEITDRPLALGFAYDAANQVDQPALIACLKDGVAGLVGDAEEGRRSRPLYAVG